MRNRKISRSQSQSLGSFSLVVAGSISIIQTQTYYCIWMIWIWMIGRRRQMIERGLETVVEAACLVVYRAACIRVYRPHTLRHLTIVLITPATILIALPVWKSPEFKRFKRFKHKFVRKKGRRINWHTISRQRKIRQHFRLYLLGQGNLSYYMLPSYSGCHLKKKAPQAANQLSLSDTALKATRDRN